MKTIGLKTDKGFEPKQMTDNEYLKWFKDHTDDEGKVNEDVILFKDFFVTVKEDGVEFMMSDMSLDRDNERIDPNGWDIKSYLDNPVILWSHDRYTPSVGIMENVQVKDGALVGTAKFVPKEVDAFSWSIGERVRQGFLKKGSVGFMPKKMEFNEDKESDDYGVLIHREQELLEYSIVNIPALPSSGAKIPDQPDDTKYYSDLFAEQPEETTLQLGKKGSEYLKELFEMHGKASREKTLDGFFEKIT